MDASRRLSKVPVMVLFSDWEMFMPSCFLLSWQRFEERCQRLIAANPQDWRARLAIGRHLAARDRNTESFEFLIAALEQNPHGLPDHPHG